MAQNQKPFSTSHVKRSLIHKAMDTAYTESKDASLIYNQQDPIQASCKSQRRERGYIWPESQ
jgi:hypothetical protein